MQADISHIKPSRCIPNNDFAKGVQGNITDFLKASITTESIKIFSITFCTLALVYLNCMWKIAKDAFKIVLYVLQLFTCSIALYPGVFVL